jgi:hypothetical protein
MVQPPSCGIVHMVLFICRRRFFAPCGHNAGRTPRLLPSVLGIMPSSRRPRTPRRRPPRPGRPPPPQGGVQGRRLGADGYSCPSARAIFVFTTAASQLVPTASSTYEDTVVVRLHLQAVAVLNVRQLVNIVLDSSTNYADWRDLMKQALQCYALIKHVTDDAPSNDLGWIQMDSIVLNWISNSISTDLHQVVRECGCTTRHLWLAIENQFLDNREQRTL